MKAVQQTKPARRPGASPVYRAGLFSGGVIESVDIQGFKSLENITGLELSSVNVLVGANGAGKSNFLDFFDMLGWAQQQRLQGYVALKGEGGLLFNGAEHTRVINASLSFRGFRLRHAYQFALQYTDDNRLIFKDEQYSISAPKRGEDWRSLGFGHDESRVAWAKPATAQILRRMLGGFGVYHFHNTSSTSPFRKAVDDGDINVLRNDGSNLAPMLHDLRENHPGNYSEIVRMLRESIPAFQEFELIPVHDRVRLRWRHKNNKITLGANNTSDGSLRLMALITLLNMPPERAPNIIFLDEPELGQHPYVISLLGALIKRFGVDKQIVVATQSPLLLNGFEPEEIIVAEMNEREGGTSFNRLDRKELVHWLVDFQPGDLWRKNVIGGNP